MAVETFPHILPHLRRHEGGYVNHPKDPGGATNLGITQRVYDAYNRNRGLAIQSVRTISDKEALDIYRHQYWNRIRGDALPPGVDYATFDAAVNSGPSRGAKWLQRAVKVSRDGIVGEITLAAAKLHDKVKTIRALCAYRLGFMQSLKIWSTFGKGWARRVAEVEVESVRLAQEAAVLPETIIREEARKESKKARAKEVKDKAIASGTGAGATITPVGAAEFDFFIIAAIFLILFVATAYFLFRGHIQRIRAAAYRKLVKELQNA